MPDDDLPRAIHRPLGTKAHALERALRRHRHAFALRIKDRPRAPASATAADVMVQRRQHRLGGKRHLPPLDRACRLGRAGDGDPRAPDPVIQRPRRLQGITDGRRVAQNARGIAHPRLHLIAHGIDGGRTFLAKHG
ncbi:MAG: hypothetical protein C0427_16650 [Rhodobacter sp.]|nr:hypothetical protein [Rhodobacter sp.]